MLGESISALLPAKTTAATRRQS